jgi:hypothetical protein
MANLPEAQGSQEEAPITINNPDVPKTSKAFVPLGKSSAKILDTS